MHHRNPQTLSYQSQKPQNKNRRTTTILESDGTYFFPWQRAVDFTHPSFPFSFYLPTHPPTNQSSSKCTVIRLNFLHSIEKKQQPQLGVNDSHVWGSFWRFETKKCCQREKVWVKKIAGEQAGADEWIWWQAGQSKHDADLYIIAWTVAPLDGQRVHSLASHPAPFSSQLSPSLVRPEICSRSLDSKWSKDQWHRVGTMCGILT